jgi:hypothetical protein
MNLVYIYHATGGHLNSLLNKSLPSVIPTLQHHKLYYFIDFIMHTYKNNFLFILNAQIVVKGKYAISSSQNFLFHISSALTWVTEVLLHSGCRWPLQLILGTCEDVKFVSSWW